MPSDLKELASAMATYERLVSEISQIEKTFPPITDKMTTLGKVKNGIWQNYRKYYLVLILNISSEFFIAKFEVELSSDMATRHENIPVAWTEYLNLLEEAKKALEMNKDKFKTELLEQAEVTKTK